MVGHTLWEAELFLLASLLKNIFYCQPHAISVEQSNSQESNDIYNKTCYSLFYSRSFSSLNGDGSLVSNSKKITFKEMFQEPINTTFWTLWVTNNLSNKKSTFHSKNKNKTTNVLISDHRSTNWKNVILFVQILLLIYTSMQSLHDETS